MRSAFALLAAALGVQGCGVHHSVSVNQIALSRRGPLYLAVAASADYRAGFHDVAGRGQRHQAFLFERRQAALSFVRAFPLHEGRYSVDLGVFGRPPVVALERQLFDARGADVSEVWRSVLLGGRRLPVSTSAGLAQVRPQGEGLALVGLSSAGAPLWNQALPPPPEPRCSNEPYPLKSSTLGESFDVSPDGRRVAVARTLLHASPVCSEIVTQIVICDAATGDAAPPVDLRWGGDMALPTTKFHEPAAARVLVRDDGSAVLLLPHGVPNQQSELRSSMVTLDPKGGASAVVTLPLQPTNAVSVGRALGVVGAKSTYETGSATLVLFDEAGRVAREQVFRQSVAIGTAAGAMTLAYADDESVRLLALGPRGEELSRERVGLAPLFPEEPPALERGTFR